MKSRTLAATLVSEGKVRVNRERATKPAETVKPGDVVTIAVHRSVRVLKVLAAGTRRGPPPEARALYEDLAPPSAPAAKDPAAARPPGERAQGSGRPTKRDRRALDRLTGRDGEGD